MGCAVSCAGILNKRSHTSLDCWTLVDFDGDGDLDLVRTVPGWGQGLDLEVGSVFWSWHPPSLAKWSTLSKQLGNTQYCGNLQSTVGIV